MTNQQPLTGRRRAIVILLQKQILWLSKYWYFLAMAAAIIILALGFLAPSYMSTRQTDTAQAIYRFLATQNHQFPERSYFVFGEIGGIQTYPLAQLLAWGADPDDPQSFVGNAEIGYKTGLNHRMLAIFVALCMGGLVWQFAGERPRLRAIPFLLLALPLLIDGYSHISSELIGDGLRDTNNWAVTLTGGRLSDNFYQGTTIGSLNWLLRTLTGLLFGLALSWFLFTYLSDRFRAIRRVLEPRLRKIGAIQ